MASSSLSTTYSAPASPSSSSARPSSTASSPSSRVSPSRGLKRTRDVEDLAPRESSVLQEDLPPAKRPHDSASSQSETSPSSVSSNESLRISNELLRSENEQLQQRLAAVDTEKTQQTQRIRNLEEDLTRIYRRQKREAETRQAEHAKVLDEMRLEMQRLTKQLDERPVVDATATVLTAETSQEMDALVAMYAQWQRKLTAMTAQLASQVEAAEKQEVAAVVQEMLVKVGHTEKQEELAKAEKNLEIQRVALSQQKEDLELLVQKIKAERDEMEAFEAMERHVLEERIVDLKKNAKTAQDQERALRLELDGVKAELVKARSGTQAREAQWQDQVDALTVRCEAQTVQLTLLREDLTSLQTENDELAADLTARKMAAAEEGDSSSIVTKQLEDRIAELKEQLVDAKTKAQEAEAELGRKHREEMETMQNRIEVLNLNVEAKAKVIEGLNAEKAELAALLAHKSQAMDVLHTEAFELQEQIAAKSQDIEDLELKLLEMKQQVASKVEEAMRGASAEKLELQKQITTKVGDWVELSREVNELRLQVETKSTELQRVTQEKSVVEAQNEQLRRLEEQWLLKQPELAVLEQKNKELTEQHHHRASHEARIQDQITTIERENRHLKKQVEELKLQTSDAPVGHNGNGLSPDVQAKIAKLVVEKRAVENFLQCYFDAAEEKCLALSKQVAQLESQHASSRQRARDSFRLLRLCAQVDSCDSAIRASLQDVMATLESMS